MKTPWEQCGAIFTTNHDKVTTCHLAKGHQGGHAAPRSAAPVKVKT